ncbi:MAG: EamA family transporter [Flavobacteriales bacterium]
MHSRRNALLLLHLTVFLWGFTGIFGKLIQQGTAHLVYTRIVIAMAGLAFGALVLRRSLSPRTPDLKHYLATSVIILLHWITFYGSIKVSTASIAAACLSTSTVFTALLEPIWFKRRILLSEVVLGIVVIAALVLIFGLETQHRLGILIGVVSALLSAWFNIINAMLVKRGEPVRISFYEMGGAATLIGIYLWATNDLPPPLWELPTSDIGWHLLLGLVCTSFAFVAGILVMRQLTPFTVMLTVNLEPIYTILIALLIWGSEEKMRGGSYLGIALIIACLFVNGWLQRRRPAAEVVEPDPLAQG